MSALPRSGGYDKRAKPAPERAGLFARVDRRPASAVLDAQQRDKIVV